MKWLYKLRDWWPLALVVAALAALFGNRRGPTDDEERLTAELQAEIERRYREDNRRDKEDIKREVEAEIQGRRAGGDPAFLSRARNWYRANRP